MSVAILESVRIVRDVLSGMAAREKEHAKELDVISKGCGDRSDGVAAGLGIAVHLLEQTLDEFGGEGKSS